jgi:predicted nucleic-acid-binding protein
VTIAVDTNILVRALMADDEQQTARAEKLLGTEEFFVPASVWLELEWVLRSVYGLPGAAIQEGLRKLLGMNRMNSDVAPAVLSALERHAKGFDFAGAFHLALCGECERLATFDKNFIKIAKRHETSIEVYTP